MRDEDEYMDWNEDCRIGRIGRGVFKNSNGVRKREKEKRERERERELENVPCGVLLYLHLCLYLRLIDEAGLHHQRPASLRVVYG